MTDAIKLNANQLDTGRKCPECGQPLIENVMSEWIGCRNEDCRYVEKEGPLFKALFDAMGESYTYPRPNKANKRGTGND